MNEKEIEYCLKQFKENKQAYMFGNGLIISFYDVFKQLKDLQKQKEQFKKWLSSFNRMSEFEVWEIENKIKELEEGVK